MKHFYPVPLLAAVKDFLVSLLIFSVQVFSLFGKCYWRFISFSTHLRLVLAWQYFWLIKCKCWPNDFCVCVSRLFLFEGWCCIFHLHAGHYRSFSLCIVTPTGTGVGGFHHMRRCRRMQLFTASPLVCVCVVLVHICCDWWVAINASKSSLFDSL